MMFHVSHGCVAVVNYRNYILLQMFIITAGFRDCLGQSRRYCVITVACAVSTLHYFSALAVSCAALCPVLSAHVA